MIYDFRANMEFSDSRAAAQPEFVITSMLAGVSKVERTDTAQDRRGIDFIATLRGGSQVFIDLKTRRRGCSRWWRNGPELALETWSVMPGDGNKGKAGWTLDESKETHYTLHVFDQSDTDRCYLLPFQELRTAFRRNLVAWQAAYRQERQETDGRSHWYSQCVFVPAVVVVDAIVDVMQPSGVT